MFLDGHLYLKEILSSGSITWNLDLSRVCVCGNSGVLSRNKINDTWPAENKIRIRLFPVKFVVFGGCIYWENDEYISKELNGIDRHHRCCCYHLWFVVQFEDFVLKISNRLSYHDNFHLKAMKNDRSLFAEIPLID